MVVLVDVLVQRRSQRIDIEISDVVKTSHLRWSKKFSITVLSKQLPSLDIDGVATGSAIRRRQGR